jgi:hypothetical protein
MQIYLEFSEHFNKTHGDYTDTADHNIKLYCVQREHRRRGISSEATFLFRVYLSTAKSTNR